jgi:hypothetical protein
LELPDVAFRPDRAEPGGALAAALAKLPETLRQKPSVVRLAYQAGRADTPLVQARLKAVRQALESHWKAMGCCYTLQFEEEVFQRHPAKKGGLK